MDGSEKGRHPRSGWPRSPSRSSRRSGHNTSERNAGRGDRTMRISDAFRPFLELELLNARIDEARKGCGRGLTGRVEELAAQMEKLKASLPDGYHLWVR